MSEREGQRPGGLWDWPVGVIVAGVLLLFWVASKPGGSIAAPLVLIGFGVVALLIRRGAFSPRK